MRARFFPLLAVIAIIISAFGSTTPSHAQNAPARFRVINALVDAPNIDVYLDDELWLSDIEFFFHSRLREAEASSYKLDIRIAGDDPSTDPALTGEFTVEETGADYFILVYGTSDSANFTVSQSVVAEKDKAAFNVFHLAPTQSNLDVVVDGGAVEENIAYLDIRRQNVQEGIYDIAFTPAGDANTTLLDEAGFPLIKNVTYSYIISEQDGELKSLLIRDGDLILGAVNAAPNSPPVDIYINGEKAFENVEYKGFSQLEFRASNRYNIVLRLTGTDADSEPIYDGAIYLPAGVVANLVVTGRLNGTGEAEMSITAYWPAPIRRPDTSGLYLIHVLPNIGPVDLLETETVIVDNIAFSDIGSASGPAGDYNVKVSKAGDADSVVVEVPEYNLQDGKNHLLIVTGTEAEPETILLFNDDFPTLRDQ
jgi:Domain of unknown function (DUF4397)